MRCVPAGNLILIGQCFASAMNFIIQARAVRFGFALQSQLTSESRCLPCHTQKPIVKMYPSVLQTFVYYLIGSVFT